MLDIHTHILPGIDDGAKNVNDSVELLLQMQKQGVTSAAATPHFFPATAVLEDFLAERDEAYGKLFSAAGKDFPIKVLPGAEVLYFEGIGSFEDIGKLTIGNSRYLLLELLGLNRIDGKIISDIEKLGNNFGIVPIIAHVERYCRYRGYKRLTDAIASGAALCQVNADFISSKQSVRAVKKLLKRGLVDFVASDCHDPLLRPVKLDAAFRFIRGFNPDAEKAIRQKTEKVESELIL